MPASAIDAGVVDHVVPLDAVATRIEELTRNEGAEAMAKTELSARTKGFSFVTCPHCHGSLQETAFEGLTEFECHVGHKFSLQSLYSEQADAVEFAMWAAIRALEESADLARRMAQTTPESLSVRFLDKHRTMTLHADTLRNMVLAGSQSTRQDVVDPVP
jgi:two-component system chemotaxis response regulator CheB